MSSRPNWNQVRDIKAAFRQLDVNGDGILALDEIAQALKLLRLPNDKESLAFVMKVFDRDGNGKIDMPEFVDMYKSLESELLNFSFQRFLKALDERIADLVTRLEGVKPAPSRRASVTSGRAAEKSLHVRVQLGLDAPPQPVTSTTYSFYDKTYTGHPGGVLDWAEQLPSVRAGYFEEDFICRNNHIPRNADGVCCIVKNLLGVLRRVREDLVQSKSDGTLTRDGSWMRAVVTMDAPKSVLEGLIACFLYSYEVKAAGAWDVSRKSRHYYDMNAAMRKLGSPDIVLSAAERTKCEQDIKVFRPLIYYLDTFLMKLPKASVQAFRGITCRVSRHYALGSEIMWPSFSSTSLEGSVAWDFMHNQAGTYFIITTHTTAMIDFMSMFPKEKEALYRCNTRLEVLSKLPDTARMVLDTDNDIVILHEPEEEGVKRSLKANVTLNLQAIKQTLACYRQFLTMYVEPFVANTAAATPKDYRLLSAEIVDFLGQSEQRVLLLRADGGCGKTAAALFATAMLLQKCSCGTVVDPTATMCPSCDRSIVVPIFLSMPSITDAFTRREAFVDYLASTLNMKSKEEIDELRTRRLFIVLDSLDEVSGKLWDRSMTLVKFLGLDPLPSNWWVMIGCRNEFIEHHRLTKDHIGFTRRAYIVRSSKDHWREYVHRVSMVATRSLVEYLKTQDDIPEDGDVPTEERFQFSWDCVKNAHANLQTGKDMAHILEKCQHEWTAAVSKQIQLLGADHTLTSKPVLLEAAVAALRFSNNVSLENSWEVYESFFIATVSKKRMSELQRIDCLNLASRIAFDMFVDGVWRSTVGTHVRNDSEETLFRALPLRLEDSGNTKSAFSFRHRSMHEFLIARVIVQRHFRPLVDPSATIEGPPVFGQKSLASVPAVIRFVALHLATYTAEHLHKCVLELYAFIATSRYRDAGEQDEYIRNAAVNAISILAHIDPCVFGLRDFEGIRVPHAQLQHSELEHSKFINADLSHSIMRHTNMSHTNLSGAKLEGAQTGVLPTLQSKENVVAIQLSFDGVVVTGHEGCKVRVWKHGKEAYTCNVTVNKIDFLAVFHSGETEPVIVVAANTGSLVEAYQGGNMLSSWKMKDAEYVSVLRADVFGGNPVLVLGTEPGHVLLRAVPPSSEEHVTFRAHLGKTTFVCCRQTQKDIVTCGYDSTVTVFSATGTLLRRGDLRNGAPLLGALHPHEHSIACAHVNNTISIFNLVNMAEVGLIERQEFPITSLTFHSNPNLLISSAEEGPIRFWGVASASCYTVMHVPDRSPINAVGLHPKDPNIIAAACENGNVFMTILVEERGAAPSIEYITAITTSERFTIVGASLGKISVYHTSSGLRARNLMRHTNTVSGLVAYKTAHLVSVSGDCSVVVWDLMSGSVEWSWTYTDRLTSIARSGADLFVGTWDGAVLRMTIEELYPVRVTIHGAMHFSNSFTDILHVVGSPKSFAVCGKVGGSQMIEWNGDTIVRDDDRVGVTSMALVSTGEGEMLVFAEPKAINAVTQRQGYTTYPLTNTSYIAPVGIPGAAHIVALTGGDMLQLVDLVTKTVVCKTELPKSILRPTLMVTDEFSPLTIITGHQELGLMQWTIRDSSPQGAIETHCSLSSKYARVVATGELRIRDSPGVYLTRKIPVDTTCIKYHEGRLFLATIQGDVMEVRTNADELTPIAHVEGNVVSMCSRKNRLYLGLRQAEIVVLEGKLDVFIGDNVTRLAPDDVSAVGEITTITESEGVLYAGKKNGSILSFGRERVNPDHISMADNHIYIYESGSGMLQILELLPKSARRHYVTVSTEELSKSVNVIAAFNEPKGQVMVQVNDAKKHTYTWRCKPGQTISGPPTVSPLKCNADNLTTSRNGEDICCSGGATPFIWNSSKNSYIGIGGGACSKRIVAIGIDRGGERVALASADNFVEVRSIDNSSKIGGSIRCSSTPRAVAVYGKVVFVGGDNGEIEVFRFRDGQRFARVSCFSSSDPVQALLEPIESGLVALSRHRGVVFDVASETPRELRRADDLQIILKAGLVRDKIVLIHTSSGAIHDGSTLAQLRSFSLFPSREVVFPAPSENGERHAASVASHNDTPLVPGRALEKGMLVHPFTRISQVRSCGMHSNRLPFTATGAQRGGDNDASLLLEMSYQGGFGATVEK